MAIGLASILLPQEVELSITELERAIGALYPEVEACGFAVSKGIVSFQVSGSTAFVAPMPAPYPWSDLEGPCRNSILWKDAASALKDHKAHLLITITSPLQDVERAILLTQVTASALRACESALGVYWGEAQLIVPSDLFLEFAAKVLPLGPPVDIWIDYRVGRQTQTTSCGFTHGLNALGHMEMEAEDWPEEPSELRERLRELSMYLLKSGPVIHDGHSVGRSAEERIRVRYQPSAFGNEGLVMRLVYESGPKPWWKIW